MGKRDIGVALAFRRSRGSIMVHPSSARTCHHASDGHRFAQVLHRLSLSGAGRALGSPAKVEVDGADQRPVAAISKWSDDEAAVVPEILVAVQLSGVDHLALHRSRLPGDGGLPRGAPIVSQLRQPVKVGHALHFQATQHLHGVSVVHVHHHQRTQRRAERLGKIAADELNNF
eukprot:scaffold2923_cov313-Pinguiococcus_pyrenoidosus.AAC.8